MRRLLPFALLLMLLAACGGNATPAAPAPATATTPPTPTPTHTPTATATPAPTFTPSPTPLPPGLQQIESQLETGWGVAGAEIQQSPASQSEVARLAAALGVSPEDLGQVYRVEANGAVFYASAETGKSYAIREVPSYFKYENGEEVIVDAHDEGLEVVRLVDDATEFSHWGNGKVVEVVYANGEHGWIYQGENGEWEKIYESGFDYEFLSRLADHFEEVTGVDYRDWAEGIMGHNTSPAQLDTEYIFSQGGSQRWSMNRYTGFYLGANWVHTNEGNFLIDVEAFPMWSKDKGHNETVLVPLLVGVEQKGQWGDLIGVELDLDGRHDIEFSGDKGSMEPSRKNLEGVLMNDHNLGKAESIVAIMYLDVQEALKLNGKIVDDEEAAKYGYNDSLNEVQLDLIRKQFPDWARWFGDLPAKEQVTLMQAIRKQGMLGVAVFEDDPALEEVLQKYPLKSKPAGFFLWGLTVESYHAKDFGEWNYP